MKRNDFEISSNEEISDNEFFLYRSLLLCWYYQVFKMLMILKLLNFLHKNFFLHIKILKDSSRDYQKKLKF